MKDWEFISTTISAKRYDDDYHIRKLNLDTAKYSYMVLWGHELRKVLKVKNVLDDK